VDKSSYEAGRANRNANADFRKPAPPLHLSKPAALTWLEMKSRGYWLTSADKFLVEIAATLMAAYRDDELKSGDVSLLIRLAFRQMSAASSICQTTPAGGFDDFN
jgi:hypothetical protein